MKTTVDFEPSPGVKSATHSSIRSPAQSGDGSLFLSKRCTKCGEIKLLGDFTRCAKAIDGYGGWCKNCHRVSTQSWRTRNPERVRALERAAYRANREKIRARKRALYFKNLTASRTRLKRLYWTNPEKERARSRQRRADNPEPKRKKDRERYLARRLQILARQKKFRQENSELMRARDRAWYKANKTKTHLKSARWYANNKEKSKGACRAWQKAHKQRVCAKAAEYRAGKSKAPGAGYTTVQHVQWRWEMWGNRCWVCGDKATATDHVIALSKGGSHWPANLRPICKPCNSRKGAKSHKEFLALDRRAPTVVQCALPTVACTGGGEQ